MTSVSQEGLVNFPTNVNTDREASDRMEIEERSGTSSAVREAWRSNYIQGSFKDVTRTEPKLKQVGVKAETLASSLVSKKKMTVYRERIKIPTTYKEAMESPQHELWEAAMRREVNRHVSLETWTIVGVNNTMTVLKSKWTYLLDEERSTLAPSAYIAQLCY